MAGEPGSIFDGIQWLNNTNLLKPELLDQMATDFETRAAKLKKDYASHWEDRSTGGLFGTGLFSKTYRVEIKPPGADTAQSYAIQLDEMSKTYKKMAQQMRDNPDKPLTDAEIAAMDPNGPDVNRGTLTNEQGPSRSQLDQALRINSLGGFGLNIPTYGS